MRMLKLLTIGTTATLAVVAMAALSAGGQTPPNPGVLNVGDPAPPFALQGSDGKVHRLADYKGKTVVLAWFAKAFTGG
jgi:cytochrome oxidase Cu insertion factor (SCO1/SenC/PrrC family)